MVWVPTLNELIVIEAAPPLTGELPNSTLPSEKVTVPVTAFVEVTAALNVTLLPLAAFTDEDESAVVVLVFAVPPPVLLLVLADPQERARLMAQSETNILTTFRRLRLSGNPSKMIPATAPRPFRVHQPLR
jgi:hypothetical protein